MNLVEKIYEFLPPLDREKVSTVDRYNEFSIRYRTVKISSLTLPDVQSILELIPGSERYEIKVTVGNNSSITLYPSTSLEAFVDALNDELIHVEDEEIIFSLAITKVHDTGIVHVYSYDLFAAFVDELTVESLLTVLKADLQTFPRITFKILDVENINFYSERLFFSSGDNQIQLPPSKTIFQKAENCDFNKKTEFPFSPIFFRLLERPASDDKISKKLDTIALFFSLTGIFDVTSLDSDSLFYKVNGFRMYESTIDLRTVSLASKDTYFRIFEWIYSDSGSTVDKLGLARNILSIYLKEDSLDIEENAFYSLQSGFKVYLQQNLNKYIDIRSKLNDELTAINEKANKAIDEYLAGFKTSLLTFGSFFISVFVLRALNTGKFDGIFNKETTLISLGFIVLMIVYLAYSLIVLNWEIQRVANRYNKLKNRFEDLLVRDDIQKILRDDDEYTEEIAYIRKKRNTYTTMWILVALILTVCIVSVSAYFTWTDVFAHIFSFVGWIEFSGYPKG